MNPEKPKSTPGKVPLDPYASDVDEKSSGRVRFDDRGNALWEWSPDTDESGREAGSGRDSKPENSPLSLAEDAPTPFDTVRPNPLGTKKGYDPYDSGKLGKNAAGPRKKKDLRRLGEWLKLKKQADHNKKDQEKT